MPRCRDLVLMAGSFRYHLPGICALIAAMLIAAFSTAVSARTLIIEGLSEAPLKWMVDGDPRGIDIDIMTEVLNDMGITDYRFQLVDNGRRLLHNAQTGSSDIVLTLSQNSERSQYLQYPQEAHLLLDWRFAVRAEDRDRITFNDFSDLARHRVGAAAEYSYTDTFWQSGLDIEVVAKNDLLIPMLLQNRFDVVPVNYLSTLYETLRSGQREKIAFIYPPLRRAPYYNVFTTASDYPDKDGFLKRYDQIIRTMRDDGRLATIFQDYLGPDGLDWWQSQYQN
ncbi:amino acid ABC transporter substrate-binding protein [Thalassospira xianhensis MCCC 1A02616]|uniref:Amino acid ABC transporter substrate-binding protein n=2 Tax=Thalassospira xianhensis TaxID=478503 RepID=A0A367UAU6_9PROT|nr:amino acid ABC transporter substrate-binding protein [Thalassospira xianhensis MCCC 1A02616]